MDKQQLAAELGVKPEALEGFILGLSIYVNKGYTLEQAIAKLLALWQSLLETVSRIQTSEYQYRDVAEAMRARLAESVWGAVRGEVV